MLSEEIKENLKQNNILSIDIHQLGYEIEKFNNKKDIYIGYLKKFLEENSNYILNYNKNLDLEISTKEDAHLKLYIRQNNDYTKIQVFSLLDLGDSYYDQYLNATKELVIYNKNYSEDNFLFKFEFELLGEEESLVLSYNVDSFNDNDENIVQLYCGEAGSSFEFVKKELETKGFITNEFFEILNLSNDLKTKNLEELFIPIFKEDKSLKLRNQLLKNNKTQELKFF